LNLLDETLRALKSHGLRAAVIGAAAMAAHGVARATMDVDLLLVGRESLDSEAWEDLRRSGVAVEVRRGASDDPLAGVIRLRHNGDLPIDVIVGAASWQRRAIDRAVVSEVLGVSAPVATAHDLILLKLYAGSPQDRWDVTRLLATAPTPDLARSVEADLGELPRESREVWRSIVEPATRRD
jgi:hypothetical protein